MRTFHSGRLAQAACLAGSLALWGCGGGDSVTVSGKTLHVVEQSYGITGGPAGIDNGLNYCGVIDVSSGQFEVFLTDFGLCTQVSNGAGNATIFHSSDETNLRLVIPAGLMKNPNGTFKVNTFTVAATSHCTSNSSGAEAVAFFNYNIAGQATYDVSAEADSGTISITGYDAQSALRGTYDLVFGGDHVKGTFDAAFCSGLKSTFGP